MDFDVLVGINLLREGLDIPEVGFIGILDADREGIVPKTIIKPIKEKIITVKDTKHIPRKNIPSMIKTLEKKMYKMADQLDFELAIQLRDQVKRLKERLR